MKKMPLMKMPIFHFSSHYRHLQIYKWTREALLRFLPIVILFVLNSQIMIAFRRRQRMFDRLKNRDTSAPALGGGTGASGTAGGGGRSSARDDTLLYILGGIAVMFFVCNIPAAINLLFINETMKKRMDYQVLWIEKMPIMLLLFFSVVPHSNNSRQKKAISILCED